MKIELVSPCHLTILNITNVSELGVRYEEDSLYPEGGRWWLTPQCCGDAYKTEEEALNALRHYRIQVVAASIRRAREEQEREFDAMRYALNYQIQKFVEEQKH